MWKKTWRDAPTNAVNGLVLVQQYIFSQNANIITASCFFMNKYQIVKKQAMPFGQIRMLVKILKPLMISYCGLRPGVFFFFKHFLNHFFLSHCNCYTFLTTFFKKYNIQYITRKEKIKYYSTVCIYELEAVGVKLIDCVKIVTNTTPSFPLFLCFSILLLFSAMYFSISCLWFKEFWKIRKKIRSSFYICIRK